MNEQIQIFSGCLVKRKNDPNSVEMTYRVTELIAFIKNGVVKASAFISPIMEYEIPGGGKYLTNTSNEVNVLDLIPVDSSDLSSTELLIHTNTDGESETSSLPVNDIYNPALFLKQINEKLLVLLNKAENLTKSMKNN